MPIASKNIVYTDPRGEGTTPAEKALAESEQARAVKARAEGKSSLPTPVLSSDPKIRAGQAVGIQRAELIYGQPMGETGAQVSDILKRRKEALEGVGPEATELRESRNRRLRMAKARGASQAELTQIERGTEAAIGREQFRRSESALSKYQKLVGNILGGQTSLEMGFAGLEKAGENVPPPVQLGGGIFGTVICTELYKQGYISDDLLKEDAKYGRFIRNTNPDVYIGYRTLADPVVRAMKKSKLFTKIISVPALAWAKNMAGEENILGQIISFFGEPLCSIVGKIKGAKHARI